MKLSEESIALAVSSIGVPFNQEQAKASSVFLEDLIEWNKETNLVSENDIPLLLDRHFTDSIFPLIHCDIPIQAKMLDIGSGGGFPAIPIKIVRQDIRLTCIESKHRKCEFLNTIGKKLNFKEFCVINMLLTPVAKDIGLFDFIISRGVMETRKFLKLSKNYLDKSGSVIIFKTEKALEEELKRVNSANISRHFKLDKIVKYKPGTGLCLWVFSLIS